MTGAGENVSKLDDALMGPSTHIGSMAAMEAEQAAPAPAAATPTPCSFWPIDKVTT